MGIIENVSNVCDLIIDIYRFFTTRNIVRIKNKGLLECPNYNYNTCSQYLKHSCKMCYLGHWSFLLPNNSFRRDKKYFNGVEDHRLAPTTLSGTKVH